MDCTNCSYRVKCCPTCGTSLETGPPLLEIDGNNVYNRSSTIKLSCFSNEEVSTYRFDDWTHSVNGIAVRRTKGKRSGKTSSLLIESCTFKDDGEYTCAAWNENNNQTYWSNKTIAVKVLDAPAVVQASSVDEPILTFSVLYYSKSQARVPKWFAYRQLLTNSTVFTISNDQTNISLDVYGIKIIRLGYCTNLSMKNPTSGEISVFLSNDYGVTEHHFHWKQGQSEFQYMIILLVLTGVIVFIITVGVTAVVIKIKTIQGMNAFKQNQSNTTRGVIYYAAPADENNKNVYDIASSDYLEPVDGETSGHYIDVTERYEEIDDRINTVQQYDDSNHYLEIDI
ncbi:Hypothetical predicted protein [Mytilus galloprovincialis]|uniref:Ig-like domain-containing protein n=1 Tax=Mytilus galloprovincialis TaxID=29158 RepID=A0A8B6FE15_MYTGA|nr:Hypothetical predicted protein [Mytilus galloprovincialis]